jgi:hypothetical protein
MFKGGSAIAVARHLKAVGVMLAALQEIRWPEGGMLVVEEYTLYWAGCTTERQFGVGFAVHDSVKHAVARFLPKSERLCAIVFEGYTRDLAVVCCHAPWDRRPKEEKDSFYEALSHGAPEEGREAGPW